MVENKKISFFFFSTRLVGLIILLFFFVDLSANNIQVTNISLRDVNTTAGVNSSSNFIMVRFSLSWDNSWRLSGFPGHWDAAWVFMKFRVGSTNPVFFGVNSSGTTITVTNTANLRVGMPVRVTDGTGAFATNTIITSINNSTQFVVSALPSTPLSGATIECMRIWEHAHFNNTGHNAAAGATIDVGLLNPAAAFNINTNPALGAFVYRANASIYGTVNFSNNQLRWNYGAHGLPDNAIISIQVFAIEMVYVPGGSDFNVGGGSGASSFTSTTIFTPTATTVPAGTGSLGGAAGGYPTGQTAPASASWPNGYNAIYCMKYEISQGQYRDFLNTLSYNQQLSRTATVPHSAIGTGALSSTNLTRNGIDIEIAGNASTLFAAVYGCNLNANTTFNETTDGEWIACNFLSWMDGCAYLDWAGLRPMTELEFEKICRGNQLPISGEYAWGNTTAVASAYTLANPGEQSEGIATNYNADRGNFCYVTTDGAIDGPLRVGLFAANTANNGRTSSGATFYGVMEMSGNLHEQTVTIGNVAGRSYTGLHGNGMLLRDGSADVSFWPGINGNSTVTDVNSAFNGVTGITAAAGAGTRGGAWNTAASSARVSDRVSAITAETTRANTSGCRGVRSF
jgi:formylglycine-generating enzyme required for sulfatase activity